MKILLYSAKNFEIPFLERANKKEHKIVYTRDALDSETAIQAVGFEAIVLFSGDDASLIVLEKLWELGVRYIALRSAGYNNVQIEAAKRIGFKVANAPDYSPYAIAEHAVALLLALNRKVVLAANQGQAYDFTQDKLIGFDLNGKTIGIIGTGGIGKVMIKIMAGFGCKILAHDLYPDNSLVDKYGVTYKTFREICSEADIISLHIPLTQDTHYLIDKTLLDLMKKDVLLVNTARGAVVKTKDLIKHLENNTAAGYATDVYETEKGVFFLDNSKTGIQDSQLQKLLSLPNALLTPHQGYLTKEALTNIGEITFYNIDCWAMGKKSSNELWD